MSIFRISFGDKDALKFSRVQIFQTDIEFFLRSSLLIISIETC